MFLFTFLTHCQALRSFHCIDQNLSTAWQVLRDLWYHWCLTWSQWFHHQPTAMKLQTSWELAVRVLSNLMKIIKAWISRLQIAYEELVDDHLEQFLFLVACFYDFCASNSLRDITENRTCSVLIGRGHPGRHQPSPVGAGFSCYRNFLTMNKLTIN